MLDGISGIPSTLLQAGDTLYWQSASHLWSLALDGASNSPHDIARSMYSDPPLDQFNLALDHDVLYWTWSDLDECGIGATPIAGGDSVAIDMHTSRGGPCPIWALAVNDAFVYAIDLSSAISRSEKRAGTTALLFATPGLDVAALAADDSALYAATDDGTNEHGLILRIPK
jgi:hypothetical protein